MKFDGICDDSIKTPTDLLRFLLTPQSKEFSDTELRTVFKAINLVNLEHRNDARGMLISIQSSKNPDYEAAGVIYLRLCELKNPGMTEQDRLLQAVDLVRCMTERPHMVLNSESLVVATGIYDFLVFRQPENVALFTDSIIAVPEDEKENRMALAMLSWGKPAPISSKPFLEALYKSIERQGDVKDWIKRNIPPSLRDHWLQGIPTNHWKHRQRQIPRRAARPVGLKETTLPNYKVFLAVRSLPDRPFTFIDDNVNLFWRFEADDIHEAMIGFLHRSKPIYRRQFASLREHSSAAFGVLLHNYLNKTDPEGFEHPRLKTMHELLLTYSESKTSKIFGQTTGLAAELFGYYVAFESKEADDLADMIIGGGDTTNGKMVIQALLAPQQKPPSSNHRSCLYRALYEAIGRKWDVAEWLKENVDQKHMPAAFSATGWADFMPIMNNKSRGESLEDSLGL